MRSNEVSWDTGIVNQDGTRTPSGDELRAATGVQGPTIAGVSVSDLRSRTATLNATIDPHGARTTYRFEYGPATAYGRSVPMPEASVGAGNGGVVVNEQIAGLLPHTTYHYRVVATSRAGETAGTDQTFTTEAQTAPVMQLVDGVPMVVVRGPGDSLVQYWATESGWTSFQIAGAGTTFSSPQVEVVNGIAQIVVRGPNDSLVQHWPAERGWTSLTLAGPGSVYSDPLKQVINGVPMIVVQGPDHTLMQYVAGEKGWGSFQIAGPGTTYSTPWIAMIFGIPQIVVRGPNDDLVQHWPTRSGWTSFVLAPDAFG